MSRTSRELVNWLGFAMCVFLLAYALFAEHVQGLTPCPLCIFQRVAMMTVGLFFLVAAWHHRSSLASRIYGLLIFLSASVGAGVSARHVWLQSLPPDKVPECGPGLEYMFDAFEFDQVLQMVFTGSGECADLDWSLLGLSMPAWVLACFVAMGVVGLFGNWNR